MGEDFCGSEVIVDTEKRGSEIKAAELIMRRIKRRFKNLSILIALDKGRASRNTDDCYIEC